MVNKFLFPKVKKLLHGGDYNPEQWLHMPEILEEDIRLMKKAHVNTATLGMFSWSVLEPEENIFSFEWLDKIIDNLFSNGIYIVLGTPSGARPAWLDKKYPEAMRVNKQGVRNKHGLRHNHCMSSPLFRKKVSALNTKLAERYGSHPGLILWHISNELGGECYCELCQQRFREFLQRKYNNDINLLNMEWWTTFWSHRYNSFNQIEPPMTGGENSIHGLNLDWKRFTSWNMTDYLKFEISVLKKITSDIPFTTNFMRQYPLIDYNEMAKEIDIISWDSYPAWNNDGENEWETAAKTAFDHSLMRSFKKEKPFMLMESVPSQVNWHPYNKLKRPGIHILSALQAVACGSDTVQYFQWRKSRGSFEQYHGAVLDHLGSSDTRVFAEVAKLGGILEEHEGVAGSTVKAKVAIIYDWPNRWAIEDLAGLSKDRKYAETCIEIYAVLMKLGIEADVISSEESLDGYKAVIAPMLYLLRTNTAQNLAAYVKKGGTLAATYLTGYVNENTLCYLGGFPGDGLREVFGLYAEEIDTIYPSDQNAAILNGTNGFSGSYKIKDFCEIIKPDTAETLAVYGSDFYKDQPVFTVNKYGDGKAYYIAARIERNGMETILAAICAQAGITAYKPPDGVEYHIREGSGYSHHFYFNWTRGEKEIVVPDGRTLVIKPFGFKIIYFSGRIN